MNEPVRVPSGVAELDRLLDGLFVGDNVVWHDAAGSLAQVFCQNFLAASENGGRPLIYATFDRSPKNLLDKLGPLADYDDLVILDCFTWGKGLGSEVFLRFYEEDGGERAACRLAPVARPQDMEEVTQRLYELHGEFTGDVRFIFESLTGMAELWGGEEAILKFYSHSCPRLYELDTVAYWVMEREAHSPRLRAQINQIAQVVIDLGIKRGTTSLTLVKAEGRAEASLHQPHNYWTRDLTVTFDSQRRTAGRVDLGQRLRDLRGKKGLSQTELAKLVGVTPSTISQVESNHIYPSLPALLKMAEVLGVEISSFFQEGPGGARRVVFAGPEAEQVRQGEAPEKSLAVWRLTPVDLETRAEPFVVEIAAKGSLPAHFFVHKGEELGYLLAGRLQMKVGGTVHNLKAGDTVYLTSEMPASWTNPGRNPARLLWLKLK
ncbi:MAG: helix-turn-helix domain-containing protein [Deltaproteobacteria bacterium]|nr:helix-turn-helix domain-containing protein [Deltaproteobacteria bacterium]